MGVTPPLTYARDDIIEDDYQHDQNGDAVKEAITHKGPPVELADSAGAEGADRNDKHDVEDGRADDATDANVVLGEEDANNNCGQLGSRAASGHEGGARHIRRQLELCKANGD